MADDEDPTAVSRTEPSEGAKKARAAAVARSYPRRTLEDALRVPSALKDKNGGNPWAPDQVAKAVGMGKSGTFYYLTAASRDFGLTEGTRDTAEISITPLGRRAVYPSSSDEQLAARREAFFKVDIFKKVVDHYHGSKLPEEPFRTNTLVTTFGLDPSVVDEFVDLFEKNCRFVSIGSSWPPVGGASALVAAAAGAMIDVATRLPQIAESGAGSVVVGVPTPEKAKSEEEMGGKGGGEPLKCFIAMPFSERDPDRSIGFFGELLQSLLIPAITSAGFEAATARRQGSDLIHSTIVNDLLDADLVLVDLTEHNPNVLFELGMRMHADKPVALIRAQGTGAIFDVDNLLRVEEYDPNLWTTSIAIDKPRLTAHIKAAWDDRGSTQTFMQILQRPS